MNEDKAASPVPSARCDEARGTNGLMGLIAVMNGDTGVVRCRESAGHAGRHHGWYSPFPGFANEHIWWDHRSTPVNTDSPVVD